MDYQGTGGRKKGDMRQCAFTLVEILVVICIIAALIAIFLGVFSHVRESGRRTTCQNNLRQIAVAIQQYVQDYEGAYPLRMSVEMVKGRPTQFRWENAITPYLKSTQVFQCPTHPPTPFIDEDYTYNHQRLNTLIPRLPKALNSGTHEAVLPNTATIWMNVDSGYMTGDGTLHDQREVTATSCGRSFFGSTLHSGGGNYSFVDGHVTWLLPEAIAELECKNGPIPLPFRN